MNDSLDSTSTLGLPASVGLAGSEGWSRNDEDDVDIKILEGGEDGHLLQGFGTVFHSLTREIFFILVNVV